MSRDDARRTGETIRQLFFNARMSLPRLVVLHKRTLFLKEEREGFLDGLSDIRAIDMLEIQENHALRYVASMQRRDVTFDDDNYPVRAWDSDEGGQLHSPSLGPWGNSRSQFTLEVLSGQEENSCAPDLATGWRRLVA